MQADMTKVSMDKATAADLRQVRIALSAAESRQVSTSEVVRVLIGAWRRTATGPLAGP